MNNIKQTFEWKKITKMTNFGLIIVFIGVFVFLSILAPGFATLTNIQLVLNQATFVGIMALGMTLVIAMGGIDLSIGSAMSFCGIVTGTLLLLEYNIFFCILIALICGCLIGVLNGVLISITRIPDFLVTLAMMQIISGILRVWTGGTPVYGLKDYAFVWLGQAKLGGFSVPFIIFLIIIVLIYFFSYKTTYGRYVASIGSNADAARLVGINIPKTKIITYLICGVLCGVSGILMAARVTTAIPDIGSGYEMNVIAAAAIGGSSLSGGKVRVVGSALGALLMTFIQNGLNLLNVDTSFHRVIMGIIILVAVGVDEYGNRRNRVS